MTVEQPEAPAAPELLAKIQHAKHHTPLIIPVKNPATGEVVGRAESLHHTHVDDALIAKFVRWRNQNRSGWLDQRIVTEATTRAWLERYFERSDMMLYLLYAGDTLVGRTGYLNLTSRSYLTDGLVRGERGGGSRFIEWTGDALLMFDLEFTGIDEVRAIVLSNNELAIENSIVYGHREVARTSLYLHRDQRGAWLDENPENGELDARQLLHFRADRSAMISHILSKKELTK